MAELRLTYPLPELTVGDVLELELGAEEAGRAKFNVATPSYVTVAYSVR